MELMKCKLSFRSFIFTILVVFFLTVPVSDVKAINSANTPASVVIGQPDMVSNTVNNGGLGPNTLNFPDSVFTDGTRLYIADFSNHRVLIYNTIPTTNNAIADIVIGQPDMTTNLPNNGGIGANTLYNPTAVYTDGTRLFVTDSSNNRVLIYNSIPTTNNASANVVIGQPNMNSNTPNNGGIAANSLSGPFMVITHGNKLLITDYLNSRVLIYNTIPTVNNASADIVIGQPGMVSNTANNGGISAKSLYRPSSVASNGTQLFISELLNNRILIFNSIPTSNNASADIVLGQPNMVSNVANNGGIGANTLFAPLAIITDNQRLFISDYANNRILIFNSIPTSNNASADVVIGQPDMTSNAFNSGGVRANTLNRPGLMSISNTHLFAVDRSNNRVLIYPFGPQNDSVSLPRYTSTANNAISLSADDAKDMMISTNQSFVGANWETFSTTKPITLSSEGTITYYVKMRDSARFEGETFEKQITYDATGPIGSVSINDGAQVTNNVATNLTLSATDVTSSVTNMMLSGSSDFSGASWEPYVTSKTFVLTGADGTKTVYMKFRDAMGNVSEVANDTITLDTTKPTIKITHLGLIDNVPDKTPLYYYFTSQTPHIKGTTEALSIVHFKYEGNDYTTTANSSGNYEINIPELPRHYVELVYYAVDSAGNLGQSRLLKLMIGVENFPVELFPKDETVDPLETPERGTPIPIPSEIPTETISLVIMRVTDQNGNLLAGTTVFIDGQKYITDKNGNISLEEQPAAAMTVEAEIGSKRVKGSIIDKKIVFEIPQEKTMKTSGWYWWWILLIIVIASVYWYTKRKTK